MEPRDFKTEKAERSTLEASAFYKCPNHPEVLLQVGQSPGRGWGCDGFLRCYGTLEVKENAA